jgi:hypothetical protein
MNVINKILNLEPIPIIDQEKQVTLDKLINVTRTSQWELLDLTEDKADELYAKLEELKVNIKRNDKLKDRVSSLPHESISIILDDEDFI